MRVRCLMCSKVFNIRPQSIKEDVDGAYVCCPKCGEYYTLDIGVDGDIILNEGLEEVNIVYRNNQE